jgi:hypothetical protein
MIDHPAATARTCGGVLSQLFSPASSSELDDKISSSHTLFGAMDVQHGVARFVHVSQQPGRRRRKMYDMPIGDGEWQIWGTLVMKWAQDETSRPRGVADLNRQMADCGLKAQYSTEQFQYVAFAQAPNATTIQIFLPTAGAVARAIQRVQQPGFRWTLPDFYSKDAFHGQTVDVDPADNLKFLAERIGDYAIGQCG